MRENKECVCCFDVWRRSCRFVIKGVTPRRGFLIQGVLQSKHCSEILISQSWKMIRKWKEVRRGRKGLMQKGCEGNWLRGPEDRVLEQFEEQVTWRSTGRSGNDPEKA